MKESVQDQRETTAFGAADAGCSEKVVREGSFGPQAAVMARTTSVRRWLAISLPWWPSDVARRRLCRAAQAPGRDLDAPRTTARSAEVPLLMHRLRRGAKEVAAVCPHAHTAGARAGMSLAEAKALCGLQAIEVESTPEGDARALRRLARWCMRYAPLVMPITGAGLHAGASSTTAPVPRQVCSLPCQDLTAIVIDVTGCERVHGGEATLVARVLRDLHRRGVHAQIAMAPTQTAAIAASAVWPCRVLDQDPHRAAEALVDLPLWTLRLPSETLEALREVNVRRIGEALALSRRESVDRLGPHFWAVLDALRGERIEPFHPLPHAKPIAIERLFDGPTTRLDAVEAAIVELVDRFCAKLALRGRGVRLMELTLLRVDALPIIEQLPLGRPSRHAKHLWTLLRPRVERANMGFGVEGVRLRSMIDAPLMIEQRRWNLDGGNEGSAEHAHGAQGAREHHALADRDDDAEMRQVAEMIDQLIARLGRDAVRPAVAVTKRDGVRPQASQFSSALRPTVIFARAMSAEVIADEARAPEARRPRAVRWPGGGGRVVRCDGPERHAPKWWDDHREQQDQRGRPDHHGRDDRSDCVVGDRDCWRVLTTDGRWLWLLHRHPECWSVIGAWA